MPFIDYYRVLGVSSNVGEEEIKTAYRKLSKKFHPDLNEGDDFFEERFKDIQCAYEVLGDKKLRNIYHHQYQIFYGQAVITEPALSPASKYDPKLFLLLIPVVLVAVAAFLSGEGTTNSQNQKSSPNNLSHIKSSEYKNNDPAISFMLILHQYQNSDTARKTFRQLQKLGLDVLLLNSGNQLYRVAVHFTRPLSDTAVIRDSIDHILDQVNNISH